MIKNIFSISNMTMIVALALSGVAAYYSIIGLTAIFAGAMVPIIVMGTILEIGKITTTVWLRKYWDECGLILKLYLVPAVIALAILTSMGIFGFLSKAHMDSGLISGDVQSKLALIDEKIKIQRDNIEVARRALAQMDSQVDARLNRGDSEQSAERAVQIRRQQAGERAKLQKEIGDSQKEISRLNEERLPLAAESRKVEAEVGPIKYVAALIYGDNPDNNLLERAVRWVIILLVIVFDPLALALVLAANASKEWDKIKRLSNHKRDDSPATAEQSNQIKNPVDSPIQENKEELKSVEDTESRITQQSNLISPHFAEPKTEEKNLFTPTQVQSQNEIVSTTDKDISDETLETIEKKIVLFQKLTSPESTVVEPEKKVDDVKVTTDSNITVGDTLSIDNTQKQLNASIETEGVTRALPYEELPDNWVKYDGRIMQRQILERKMPHLFAIADTPNQSKNNFGIAFPKIAARGDIFVRIDVNPNRVFKFDGIKWIEINKNHTSSYLDNNEYIQFLINKVYLGEYDLESLTEDEKHHIEDFLKNQKT